MTRIETKTKTNKRVKYTPVDAGHILLNDLSAAQEESDNFGYMQIRCRVNEPCSAVYHSNGQFEVICINPHCCSKQRRYTISPLLPKALAARWNEEGKQSA